jgi:hypothetical protein
MFISAFHPLIRIYKLLRHITQSVEYKKRESDNQTTNRSERIHKLPATRIENFMAGAGKAMDIPAEAKCLSYPTDINLWCEVVREALFLGGR